MMCDGDGGVGLAVDAVTDARIVRRGLAICAQCARLCAANNPLRAMNRREQTFSGVESPKTAAERQGAHSKKDDRDRFVRTDDA